MVVARPWSPLLATMNKPQREGAALPKRTSEDLVLHSGWAWCWKWAWRRTSCSCVWVFLLWLVMNLLSACCTGLSRHHVPLGSLALGTKLFGVLVPSLFAVLVIYVFPLLHEVAWGSAKVPGTVSHKFILQLPVLNEEEWWRAGRQRPVLPVPVPQSTQQACFRGTGLLHPTASGGAGPGWKKERCLERWNILGVSPLSSCSAEVGTATLAGGHGLGLKDSPETFLFLPVTPSVCPLLMEPLQMKATAQRSLAELPVAVMDMFNNTLDKEAGRRQRINCKGCQEGRNNMFKHMGWDSSHLTNHVKIKCMFILFLPEVWAKASFQKVICPVPKEYPSWTGSEVLWSLFHPVDNKKEYRQLLD
ncbi:uncharacterized protein LOC128852994 isoform X2 [Cuculus canorus]|uniref:uncharacterized protein LOC128852994 isoform X2 n=1 Tax=Cuculus canorus TaxID=55661 RepID=UPI0023AA86D3|nr:uncharacterized protein LOC128852994 isoform X2 [Cuculus canorus]XP_053930038.1 uncharacterized protein LOC128852994 isoform X2 [Cuculus canorus]